jgi:glycosyltransferase involved in cell wall biosynthesis
MTTPLVSVIIPTYNRSWGLRRALRSVLDQSFLDFEVLVADDCSVDDSAEVARAAGDPRVRYHCQERNVGVARNWGTGLSLSGGKFVCFLMDDDWYEKNFLARRVEALGDNARLICVFGGYRRVDLAGKPLGLHQPSLPVDRELSGAQFLEATVSRSLFIGATMYRADVVKALWGQIEEEGLIVDYALNARLALLPGARARFLPEVDFAVSDHADQMSNARSEDVFRDVSAFLERLLAATPEPAFRRVIRSELASWNLLRAVRARKAGDSKASLHHLLGVLKRCPLSFSAWKQLLRVTTGL